MHHDAAESNGEFSSVSADSGIELYDLGTALKPVLLPCGKRASNRFVKAATYEHAAHYFGSAPTESLLRFYERWSEGEWGMIMTGNVQVSSKHLSLGADMVVPERLTDKSVEKFGKLATAIKGNLERAECPLAIMQLNHTGRQSPNFIGGRMPFFERPISASATRVGSPSSNKPAISLQSTVIAVVNGMLFQTAKEMTLKEVENVREAFARGAQLAVESGFDGVQIHAAHGYLVSQFISRHTNLRPASDPYSSPIAFLHGVFSAIRAVVPADFAVGIKLNSSDFERGGMDIQEGLKCLEDIVGWEGLDFVEVSGGDYERPDFMTTTSSRQAYFESFSCLAVQTVERVYDHKRRSTRDRPPLIMLTGGLRTRAQFRSVLENRYADLLGLARLAIVQPDLPRLLRTYAEDTGTPVTLSGETKSNGDVGACDKNVDRWEWETHPLPNPPSPHWWPRLIGAGIGMAWYVVAMRRLSRRRPLPLNEHWVFIILEMWCGVEGMAWLAALVPIVAVIFYILCAS